ncbi:structural protein [Stenotrophomonas phage BUCT627]|uniref:Structural protein n=1 Tax=Stenotrophomonas phage BUCT627 TaxID=2860377 RepID=A0AC61N9Z8_9CAUD|nr:structural protein [Stenotrophomonas phage BUCT627]QYC96686.1 structural protein [Stenotrophomonas phage BUCT627]
MNANHMKKYELAKRLIKKHGRKVDLMGIKSVPIDPTKPWNGSTNQEVVLTTVDAVFVPYQGSGFGETVETGNMFSSDVQVCLCAPPLDLDTNEITKIRDGGVIKGIEWKEVLKPSDVRVIVGIGVKH